MDSVAALQARNADLERQLQQARHELRLAQAQLEKCDPCYQQFQQTQAQLNDILQSAIVCITHFRLYADRHCEHFYCSPGGKVIFGYEPEELMDASFWWSRIPPEDQAMIVASNAALFAGQTVQHEYRFRHKDGNMRWIAGTLTARRDDTADYWLVTAVDTDISDRKRAEAALNQKIARERLMATMIQRIRQALDPDIIFQATVTEVRQFLACDRVLIYQFDPEDWSGHVTYESVVPGCLSILGMEVVDEGFFQCINDYLVGRVQVTADIYTAEQPVCYVAKQAEMQVRANLVVPIVKQAPNGTAGELWGLLAAQYCHNPHQWEDHDIVLLRDLATQIALALQQAQLYANLQRSELQLRTLLDSATAAIVQLHAYGDGTVQEVYYSAGCERLYGYSAEELLADPNLWLSRVHPEDLATIITPIHQAGFAHCPFQIEYRIYHRDGSIRWIAARGNAVQEPGTDYVTVTIVDVDITVQKQAELALRESEERFQEIAHTINQIFFVRSATTQQYLYISPAYEVITGQPCAALYQDPAALVEMIHPDDRSQVLASLASVDCELAGNSMTHEYRIIRPDGEIRWILSDTKPVRDATGRVERYVGIAIDITDCKRIENTLRQSEARNRAILAAIPDMMALISADGRYLGLIRESQSLVNLIDDTGETSPVGQHITQLMPPEIAIAHLRCIQQALATGEVQAYEKMVMVNDRPQYEEVRIVPMNADTVLLLVRDIGDRKRAELALQQQIRYEQALSTVIQAIHQSLDLDTIFATTTREITQLLDVTRAAIVRYYPEHGFWQQVARWQDNQCISVTDGEPIPDASNPFADRLKQGQVVVVDVDHPIQDPINLRLAEQLPPPWLLVPIVVNQATWGSFTVKGGGRSCWQPEEITVASRIAEQLAIAIHQAQLYQQVQAAYANLECLNQQLEARVEERTCALQESEAMFRSLFNEAPIGIVLNPLGADSLHNVNQKFCQITGYTPEELQALTIDDITHPDDRAIQQPLMAAFANGSLPEYQLEKRYITKHGEVRWVQLTAKAIRNATGEILYGLGMVEDITNRKLTEDALRHSEAQNRAILNAVPDLLLRLRRDGTCTRLVQPSLPGGSIAPSEQSVWDETLAPEHRQLELALCQQALATGTIQVYERQIERQGKLCHEEVRISPCGEDEALLMVRDISDRKQAEVQIRASLQEKELLLKEIHHRVKNNLQIICSLLSLQANTFNDPRIVEPLQESQRRVRTMSLVHERLYQTTSLAEIDIAAYIVDLVQDTFHASMLTNNPICLRFDLDNLYLEAETAIACGLILNELVANAIKHAFPDDRPGEICIRLKPHPTIVNSYTLSIADNGVGIPKTVEIDNTDSLGLQVVCALVAQIYGTLEVDRQQGTAFHITFPLQPEHPHTEPPPQPSPTSYRMG